MSGSLRYLFIGAFGACAWSPRLQASGQANPSAAISPPDH